MRRVVGVFGVLFLIACGAAGVWLYRTRESGIMPWEEAVMKNVYVTKESGDILQVYDGEGVKEYKVKGTFQEESYHGVADVYLCGGRMKKLVCKPEKIRGNVLEIGEQYIDIENYGMLPQADGCTYYQLSDGIVEADREQLLIGQNAVDFVVAEGKICSILFQEEEQDTQPMENLPQTEQQIRVAIKTDGYASYEHPEIQVRGTGKIVVASGKEKTEYPPGEMLSFTPESLKEKRSVITSEEGGRIEVVSLKRNMGTPAYRGRLEVVKAEGGLHLINELGVEEYLCGVLPSEMPASYEKEALKAQAVCARSYAIQHIKNNRLKKLGAHVDDSVSYQVYNNIGEEERCNQAVEETRGEKAYEGDEIASTYFFSTSCGVTTSSKDVSFSTREIPYLMGKLQERSLETQPEENQNARLVAGMLGDESLFAKFLQEDRDVLDKNQPWYRWSTSLSLEEIGQNINAKLGERSRVAGDKIQVKQPDGSFGAQPIEQIGTLKSVKIKERGSGGVAVMAQVKGSEATIRVYSEYNIRLLLFHETAIVCKKDGTNVSGLTMLPSGFFVLKRSGNVYQIQGGGFGHGTGLSQTGANELAQEGRSYLDILQYYFPGTTVKGNDC